MLKINDCHLIYYKQNRFISSQILKEYSKQMEGSLDLVIKRATSAQTIILTEEQKINPLTSKKEIKLFLRKSSKSFPSIFGVDFLASGGESSVYRLNHADIDEVVIKTPLFKEST
jgi:hypothetical protein